MQYIFIEILQISLFTGILIGLLFFATRLLQKRYSARWRSILWMLIAIRLLLFVPLPPSSSLNFLSLHFISISSPNEVLVTISMIESVSDEQPLINEITSVHLTTIEQFIANSSPSYWLNIQVFMYIWLLGIVIFLFIHLWAYIKFVGRLKNSNVLPIPKHIWNLLEEQSNLLGLKKFPLPIITNAISSPVLIGLFAPKILLPHGNYSNDELTFILRHELIHYKRKDIFCKWLLLLANALHWFNPLVYFMANQVAKDIELSCDDYVVDTLAEHDLKQYCMVLVSTLPTNHTTKRNIVLTEMGNNAKEMKKRLCNILDRSHRQRGVFALCLLVMCMVIITSIVRTSYNSSPRNFEQFIAVSNSNNENIWNHEEIQEHQATTSRTVDGLDLDTVLLSLPTTVNLQEWAMLHVPTVGVFDLRISHIVELEPIVVHGVVSNDQFIVLVHHTQ